MLPIFVMNISEHLQEEDLDESGEAHIISSYIIMEAKLIIHPTSLPPASAVEVIESEPSFRLSVIPSFRLSVCQHSHGRTV